MTKLYLILLACLLPVAIHSLSLPEREIALKEKRGPVLDTNVRSLEKADESKREKSLDNKESSKKSIVESDKREKSSEEQKKQKRLTRPLRSVEAQTDKREKLSSKDSSQKKIRKVIRFIIK